MGAVSEPAKGHGPFMVPSGRRGQGPGTVDVAPTTAHPLEAMTADEIRTAVSVVRESGRLDEGVLFAAVTLDEPGRASLAAYRPGDPRRSAGPAGRRPGTGAVGGGGGGGWFPPARSSSGRRVTGCARRSSSTTRPGHPGPPRTLRLAEAMRRRGITDFEQGADRPLAGRQLRESARGRPPDRAVPLVLPRGAGRQRLRPTRRGRARHGGRRPWRRARGARLRGRAAAPGTGQLPSRGQRAAADRTSSRWRSPSRRVPSFTLDGNLLTWQRWSMRVSMDPLEGLVLHAIGYDDGGIRPILHRASICEMVVPYGDPGPMHGWKNAFDVGEWGLGRMANSLALGCDCLGRDRLPRRRSSPASTARPYVVENAVCIHEEDYGILWKHQDMNAGRTEVRRSRRLVVSSIATVGNYEYGFYWYFYLDGTIQHEVKLTGIMSTQALAPDERAELRIGGGPGAGRTLPPAPVLRPARPRRRRTGQRGLRGLRRARVPAGDDNPLGQLPSGQRPSAPRVRARSPTRRGPASGRHWRFVNPAVTTTASGRPVAYKLVPGPMPTLLARPQTRASASGRASPATTCGSPRTRPTSGGPPATTPTSTPGGDGLPGWTDGRPVPGRDRAGRLAHLRRHPSPRGPRTGR